MIKRKMSKLFLVVPIVLLFSGVVYMAGTPEGGLTLSFLWAAYAAGSKNMLVSAASVGVYALHGLLTVLWPTLAVYIGFVSALMVLSLAFHILVHTRPGRLWLRKFFWL